MTTHLKCYIKLQKRADSNGWVRGVDSILNPGGWQQYDGHNLPPMVWVGLTDLPNSGGALAPSAPSSSYTSVSYNSSCVAKLMILQVLGHRFKPQYT